jgi:hypothetical protein
MLNTKLTMILNFIRSRSSVKLCYKFSNISRENPVRVIYYICNNCNNFTCNNKLWKQLMAYFPFTISLVFDTTDTIDEKDL